MDPRLTVIVPAYNEETYLGATLESLAEAVKRYREKTGREAEVLVVNNASTDRTEAVAGAHGVRVVFEPHRQIAAARNRGAKEAKGEILVTCDADNWVTPNLLESIDRAMSSGTVVGGGVPIWPEERHWAVDLLFWFCNRMGDVFGISFGVLYTDRDTFWRVGGSPTTVYAGEDALFAWALKREGRRRHEVFFTLKDAHIVTSLRKIEEFGWGRLLLTFLKFVLTPWVLRRRENCPTWYEVRDSKMTR